MNSENTQQQNQPYQEQPAPQVPPIPEPTVQRGPSEAIIPPQDWEGDSQAPPTPPSIKTTKKGRRKKGQKALSKSSDLREASHFTPQQKLLLLDIWKRSGLSATDFAELVGVSSTTMYGWRKAYEKHGAEGLFGKPKGPEPGVKVDSVTKRAILLLKEDNPEYGCLRISQLLYRGPGLGVSPATVSRVLKEEGYLPEERRAKHHPDKPRRFERAAPNQLWQSDLFTFTIKRRRHRVHLVGFMDDHSRFLTGFGLASSPTSNFVLEVVRSAIGSYGHPEEILTDQGPQYHSWRGKTTFEKELRKLGIKHIMARPRHPQTLGKIERFWKTLWEECLGDAVFTDINDARDRIAHYIDHYNFRRTHQGIEGLVPADRFFGAADEIRKTLDKRVADNALEIARNGEPATPFYLAGRVGDQGVSVHAEGEKLVMTTENGRREEVSLERPEQVKAPEATAPMAPQGLPLDDHQPEDDTGPGDTPLDRGLEELAREGIVVNKRREVDHAEEE